MYSVRRDGEFIASHTTKIGFKEVASMAMGLEFKEPKRRKYTIETEKVIRILEGKYSHSAHCELQVQMFYKPADPQNDFSGYQRWENGDSYYRQKSGGRERVEREIERLCIGYEDMFKEVDFSKVRWGQVADYYKNKVMYNETIETI
jgi:hypothetical protein